MNDKGIVKITTNHVIKDMFKPYENQFTGSSTGTGFFVDNYHILTCYHVIDYIKFLFRM